MNFKKKIVAGILSGALIFTGAAPVFAAPPQWNVEDGQEIAANIDGWTTYLTKKYGVDSAQVRDALTQGVHIRDIQIAAVLAKLSGKSFSDVLAMKMDWRQVAEKLGVTRENIDEFYRQQMSEQLAHESAVDVKTVESLLKDGYNPRDIVIAGRIAKAAGKDIKSVLSKRKINNTWHDVAKSFGVDIHQFMPLQREEPPTDNFFGQQHDENFFGQQRD